MAFKPRLDRPKLFEAYQRHRQASAGTDRDFLREHPEVSEVHFRKLLKEWREAAQAGLDPLTGQPSPTGACYLLALEGRTANQAQPETLDGTGKSMEDRKGESLQHVPLPATGSQVVMTADLLTALKVRRAAMRGKRIAPLRLKAAEQVIKEATQAGQRDSADKASEFAGWSRSALVDLLRAAAPEALAGLPAELTAATPSTTPADEPMTAPDGLPPSI